MVKSLILKIMTAFILILPINWIMMGVTHNSENWPRRKRLKWLLFALPMVILPVSDRFYEWMDDDDPML